MSVFHTQHTHTHTTHVHAYRGVHTHTVSLPLESLRVSHPFVALQRFSFSNLVPPLRWRFVLPPFSNNARMNIKTNARQTKNQPGYDFIYQIAQYTIGNQSFTTNRTVSKMNTILRFTKILTKTSVKNVMLFGRKH